VDESFVAERRRIGEIHERVGLEPRFYLGAYALISRSSPRSSSRPFFHDRRVRRRPHRAQAPPARPAAQVEAYRAAERSSST
jgi:hypothetical protein